MADLSIIVPLTTRNIVTNPSIEDGTDDWVASGSVTLTRTFERARFGVAALQVVTDGLAENEGTFFRTTPETQNLRYFGSVYVRGEGKIRIRLKDQFNGNEAVSDTLVLSDERWSRLSVRSQTGPISSDDLRLYIETVDGVQATTFYVDGAQIEQTDFLTSYCDGEQPGCRWNIVKNASESSRDAQERSGGRIVDITDADIYVTLLSGVGMPPLRNTLQEFPFVEGAFFQRTKTLARAIDITFNIKDEEAQGRATNDLDKLHQIRQNLLDIIKPDLVRDSQAFTFIYSEVDKPDMFIRARYDAGFESSHDIRNKFFDSFTLRLLAEDPFWFEDTQEIDVLDFADTLENRAIINKIDGIWGNMDGGTQDAGITNVVALAEGLDGTVYMGGLFNEVGIPNIVVNNIAAWDGESWSALGPGFDDGVEAIAVAPNGDIYAGGSFRNTFGGGTVVERIARWDGSSWNPVGAGLDAAVKALAFAPNGDLYIGGDFGDIFGGIGNTLNKVARWDGSNYSAIGSNIGLNGDADVLVINNDGSIVYFGGTFTDENGNPGTALNGVAQYTVATDVFADMDAGTDTDTVFALALDTAENLYVGGDFATVGATPITVNGIAKWNGNSWIALSTGLADAVGGGPIAFWIEVDSRGLVWIIGDFRSAGGVDTTDFVAAWNGATFVNIDTEGDNGFNKLLIARNDDFYFSSGNITGLDDETQVGHVNIVNNPGTTIARPIILAEGPGFLRLLENCSTNQRIFINYNIADDETLTIDVKNASVISSKFGNLFSATLQPSNLGSFVLLPGDNRIGVFMNQDNIALGSRVQMSHEPRHWSVDAIGL